MNLFKYFTNKIEIRANSYPLRLVNSFSICLTLLCFFTISALGFSKQARDKLKKAGCETRTIMKELMNKFDYLLKDYEIP
jgi:hypothetical protein